MFICKFLCFNTFKVKKKKKLFMVNTDSSTGDGENSQQLFKREAGSQKVK